MPRSITSNESALSPTGSALSIRTTPRKAEIAVREAPDGSRSPSNSHYAGPENEQLRSSKRGRCVAVAVEIPSSGNIRKEEYAVIEGYDKVEMIIQETSNKDGTIYEVMFGDTHIEKLSLNQLLGFNNASTALNRFQQHLLISAHSELNSSDSEMQARGLRKRPTRNRSNLVSSDEDDLNIDHPSDNQHKRGLLSERNSRQSSSAAQRRRRFNDAPSSTVDSSSEDATDRATRRGFNLRNRQSTISTSSLRRSTRVQVQSYEIDESEDGWSSENSITIIRSDSLKKRKRRRPQNDSEDTETLFGKMPRTGTRRSERATRNQYNMKEPLLDNLYRTDSEPEKSSLPKIAGIRELFKELPRNDEFRQCHVQDCETCAGNSTGPLVFCQGCTLAYHKNCLGTRNTREHLVTKVGDSDFILQCRRCINTAQKKDGAAPNLAKCQTCNETGAACIPFRDRKTALQEQKEREDNGGEDPVTSVDASLINNPTNVLFRCLECWRAFHFHHLPSRSSYHIDVQRSDEEAAIERLHEYSHDWLCKECVNAKKISAIIAWRPVDEDAFTPGTPCSMVNEDEKQYLVKWEKQSYFRANWMPGAWVWGVTAPVMRKAFNKRETGPKMRTEDAIPEEYLRIDIILDVKYTSIVTISTEEIDRARIKEVDEALIKYKGLGYEDAVWENVPVPEDGERWTDFEVAYNDWVLGRYVHIPKTHALKLRLEKVRSQPFTKLERTKQPDNLAGGELMKYQMDGLNWLYYQWYSKKNGILADEMGLGKTIQVISFIATMVQEHNCFPFLIVVPNSTCANWRREIKHWAPSLRVVTYFGSSASRSMAYQYELYPNGSKDLRCHVVVTSFEAAADDSCRRFFKGVPWAGLIIDEGQRLKSDQSILYAALTMLKISFRILLTGTPLQNNARELFNLIQFLDDTIDAQSLEEKYIDMTKENITQLHDQIRPYILRRTKAQVLTFLPPMAQIIVPLSMSVLQKKLYKSILAKNPTLLRALFTTQTTLKPTDRSNLSNILMQLRKCLCHPFIYSQEIEERTDIAAISHRNLVEASAKLQLLELLLPKLRERGHRVLIFSQFLDMLSILEDFLDGLEMNYQRLDGTMGSLEKQKRIDEFNAPDSSLFAFLLSTRAGGVGINLATADTVIILDPDFNPHQDIQALSRAHRIGQKKKVLCFQFVTRASAEEKIMQIGRKKMALDHVVVDQLDTEDVENKDVESILKHGAAELFADSHPDQEIRYDSASVDRLLDRSQIENTKSGDDNSAESQFSFARVWANDQATFEESLPVSENENGTDPTVWEKILQERERVAAEEVAAREQALGRGKRARMVVDYGLDKWEDGTKPSKDKSKHRGRRTRNSESDTDFQDNESEGHSSIDEEGTRPVSPLEDDRRDGTGLLSAGYQQQQPMEHRSSGQISTTANAASLSGETIRTPTRPGLAHQPRPESRSASTSTHHSNPFVRIAVSRLLPQASIPHIPSTYCHACTQLHPRGACPLKLSGVEHCPLCGLAHYGHGRVCPHIGSETQVREMIEAIKQSNEPIELKIAATRYLRGVKGHLVQAKKKKAEQALAIQGENNRALATSEQVDQGN